MGVTIQKTEANTGLTFDVRLVRKRDVALLKWYLDWILLQESVTEQSIALSISTK